jgi:GAF domain-containing protein
MHTMRRLNDPVAPLNRNYWDLLTKPSSAVAEVGQRRKARLISGLAVLLLAANLIGLLGSLSVYRGRITSSVMLLVSLAVCSSVAYAISRTRHFLAGGFIVITSLFGLGYAGIFLGRDPVLSGLFYAPLAYLIAAGILGWRGLAALTGLNVLILMLMPTFTPAVTWQLAGTLSGEYLTAGVLSLVVARARDAIERSRLAELREANRKLQELGASLEQRVEARTREISLAAEVGQRINRVRDGEVMLSEAVELIAGRFDLYYTQIYLLDARGHSLVLRAGSGEAGRALKRRAHRLPVDRRSICGTAVVEQRVVTVQDTRTGGIFMPNPLLPETRSEMAIPLISGERVLGVLDLQSRTPGSLQEEHLAAYETLAGQLATALANLDLFEQVQRSMTEVERYSRRAIQQGWGAYLDGIAMPERLGYCFEAGQVHLLDRPLAAVGNLDELRRPIQVGGVEVGVLQLSANQPWQEDAPVLVETVAAQVAQQVENLRLLEQSGRYQKQAQEALQRLIGEGWEKHAALAGGAAAAFVYKGGKVQPLEEEGAGEHLQVELKVQNAVIGALGVAGRDKLAQDEQQLVAVIAEQLGAHLENIRLVTVAQTELAERQQTELALRESEASLSEAMQISRMGSWIYDAQLESIWLSREHQWMLGAPAGDEAGMLMPLTGFLEQYVMEADRSGFAERLINAADGEEWTFHALSADGQPRILSVTTRRKPGEQERVSGTAQDVTEAHRSQALIARRAEELERVAHVATTVATIQNPDEMLQTVVDLVQEHFAIYHAHIYLMDERAGVLSLARGAGEVGRRMAQEGRQIPLDAAQSIVARAARSRRGLIVNHARQEPDFLPHPLLPDTHSEMAVPMIAGDRLVGILDVQDDDPDRFSAEDVNILTTLAAQVAVSLQNARSFVQAQRQAEREALINTISERIQSTSSVEAALQVAVREIGRALGARHTAVRLGVDQRPGDGSA